MLTDEQLLDAASVLLEVHLGRGTGSYHGMPPSTFALFAAMRAGATPWALAELTGRPVSAMLKAHRQCTAAVKYAPASRLFIDGTHLVQKLKALSGRFPDVTAEYDWWLKLVRQRDRSLPSDHPWSRLARLAAL